MPAKSRWDLIRGLKG